MRWAVGPRAARTERPVAYRRRVRVVGVLVAAVTVAGGLTACSSADSPKPTAEAFLSDWSAGHLDAAAARTTDPAAAKKSLAAVATRLQVAKLSAHVTRVEKSQQGGQTPVDFIATMSLRGLGDWTYDGRLALGKADKKWAVIWSDQDIHPALTQGRRLTRTRALPERAPILDAAGQPLFTKTETVTVGIEPRRLTDPAGTIAVLQRTLGIDPARVRKAVAAAAPDAFVPVITLRRSDYDAVRPAIHDLPGLVFHTGSEQLAPTSDFARALLGRVGQATADVLKNAGPAYVAGDHLGLYGLQAAFQQRLAGKPGGTIAVTTAQGDTVRVLKRFDSTPGQPVRTTLDLGLQNAAEQALAGVDKPAALVAVRPSDGAILAVANRPADSALDRALTGRYPPGSTFKIVTTYALLGDGVSPDTTVPCPPKVVVNGKAFTNFEGETAGAVPFSQDFVMSCNTAFVEMAKRLQAGDLPAAGKQLGLGTSWQLPLAAFTGSVPAPSGPVEQAADAIGQGKVLASPLDLALVAAAVRSGSWRPPVLVTDPAPQGTAQPQPLDASRVSVLQGLMAKVVASGTASSAGLPPGTSGKTGTAEFGTANPPETHAWFVGFRGDLAFAVLVEGGGVGGRVAAPIAAKFLTAVGG